MELLERFARRELEAFETLFRHFQREVDGWILRIVRDPGIAEELTVETFWRIHRAHARLDPTRSFGAWARRIATNVVLDYLKAVRLQARLPENPSQGLPPNPALRREIRERIEDAFRQLPGKLQPVATLALIEQKPYEELTMKVGLIPENLIEGVALALERVSTQFAETWLSFMLARTTMVATKPGVFDALAAGARPAEAASSARRILRIERMTGVGIASVPRA